MQYASNDLARDIISKETSQSCLQNEHQSGPSKRYTFHASSTFERSKFIVVPSKNDILCGRGKSFFSHEGNKRFRDIVDKYINPYIMASNRSKRSEIVKAVVHETLETGARFLKKSENKLEWYAGGGKVATEKVGHALRDATSDKNQALSKKRQYLHEQKKQQQTLKGKLQISKCNGNMEEAIESETFSMLSYDSPLDRKEAKEKSMPTRCSKPPFYDNAQMLIVKYNKQIPIEVEDLIFSDASFHNNVYTVLFEKHKHGSVECADAIDTVSLDVTDKAKNSFPSLVSLANCKEPKIETLLTTSSITSAYLNGVQKSNLKNDEQELTVAAVSIFSEQGGYTNFNDKGFNSCYQQDMKKKFASRSNTSVFCPQEFFLTRGREGTRNHFESCSKNSSYIQESQMDNFKNNKCIPVVSAASSLPFKSCSLSNLNIVDFENQEYGTLENLEQSFFATAPMHKELDIPLHIEDAIMNCNEKILIPSDFKKKVPNNLREFQKSDLSNAENRNMMDLASSIMSEACYNAMHSELGPTNHNQTQSCGSLDSSHIDVLNNIHLEDLDLFASSLGCQDTLD